MAISTPTASQYNKEVNRRIAAEQRLQGTVSEILVLLRGAREAVAEEPYAVDVARERLDSIQELLRRRGLARVRPGVGGGS